MQVVVTYYTRSGNTRKLAEEVAQGVKEVKGVECIVKAAAEVTKEDFLAADGIYRRLSRLFRLYGGPFERSFRPARGGPEEYGG